MTTAAQALEARQTVEEVMRLADAVADAGSQMLPAVEIARRLATLRAALESTAAELEALRKDAERYRVLCTHYTAANFNPSDPDGLDLHGKVALIFCFSESLAISGDLSATIDSAAALTQGGK